MKKLLGLLAVTGMLFTAACGEKEASEETEIEVIIEDMEEAAEEVIEEAEEMMEEAEEAIEDAVEA
ncbi:hypothetical protein A3SI_18136 [Nitritalea halalkaliphila LW7]|uniref:Lipoprotein n=1 Tax=Nitritalea halalkaliphila LW7 TaxID=1189621 RepID=I5BUV6_9BACT|nr:hypothetical protein [Nitritalea halalkaliphila]EIM73358.1 hypothetical protein A3SI_18136 [Nitritalea halalkaliphila LW7]